MVASELEELYDAFQVLTVDGTPGGDLLTGGLQVSIGVRQANGDEEIVMTQVAGRMHRELRQWNPLTVAVTVYRTDQREAWAHMARITERFRMMRSQGGEEHRWVVGNWMAREVQVDAASPAGMVDTPTAGRVLYGVRTQLGFTLQSVAYPTR